MNIPCFTDQTLWEIYESLRSLRIEALKEGRDLCFDVPNPDIRDVYFSGETSIRGGRACIVRSYRAWVELGELMLCRFKTPVVVDEYFVRLRWEPFEETDSWHTKDVTDPSEKYGVDSLFFRINKLEEPHFLLSLRESYLSLNLQEGDRVLCLGSHKGDEFHLLRDVLGEEVFSKLICVGVDHCSSAVAVAQEGFDTSHVTFLVRDLNELKGWVVEPFHLIVSVGTLQSPGVDSHVLFRELVKGSLHPRGSVILGFPNCRYTGGELQYGARMKNYKSLELSLLLKDVMFYKKYLQQHRFRVRLTGKYYLFLIGIRSGS